MKCKTCGEEYTASDPFRFERRPNALMNMYGWHPSYGDCYLCFCYLTFGGMMEPWGQGEEMANQFYEITPPGVRSVCHCDKDLSDFFDRVERECGEWPEDDQPRGPDVEIPF